MMMDLMLEQEMFEIESKNLKRKLRLITGSQGPIVMIDGKEYLNFCSNNYLGLANDPHLVEAASVSMKEEGFGSGASRLVCGNMSSHEQLERSIAKFKQTEAALVFSSGYMANVGVISSLFGREDWIFSDKLNHASIIDGILLSQANYKRYPHLDTAALEEMLKSIPAKGKRLIVTDSVFSMDGDVAPLPKIVALAKKYNSMVMVDEAHAVGVFGKRGRGLAEHLGVEQDIDIIVGTLSKAAGSFGAYCSGSKKLIEYLINSARSFIYTTAMPPSTAAASIRALEIIQEDVNLRKKLWNNTKYLHGELKKLGFDTMNAQTPIIPILVKDSKLALDFSQKLFERGILISAIRPPTVPVNTARLRLTVTSAHTKEHLDQLIEQLQTIGKELCLI